MTRFLAARNRYRTLARSPPKSFRALTAISLLRGELGQRSNDVAFELTKGLLLAE
jgi:hypothetical protein